MSVFSPSLDTGDIADTFYASPEVSDANLHSAIQLVDAQLGVEDNNLTYEQRLIFDQALATVIVKFPQRFTEQAVVNAQDSLKKNFGSLEDSSLDWSQFGQLFEDSALAMADKGLGAIGRGATDLAAGVGKLFSSAGKTVENAGTLAKYALPVIAVVAIAAVIVSRAPVNYGNLAKAKGLK